MGIICHRQEQWTHLCAKIDLRAAGAHADVNAAQSIQSLSLSGFSPDVVRGLYFEYWHLDADRGAGLAHLPPEPFRLFARFGPVPGRHSYISVLALRWRAGRPRRAAQDSTGLAIRANGQRRGSHSAGRRRMGPWM